MYVQALLGLARRVACESATPGPSRTVMRLLSNASAMAAAPGQALSTCQNRQKPRGMPVMFRRKAVGSRDWPSGT